MSSRTYTTEHVDFLRRWAVGQVEQKVSESTLTSIAEGRADGWHLNSIAEVTGQRFAGSVVVEAIDRNAHLTPTEIVRAVNHDLASRLRNADLGTSTSAGHNMLDIARLRALQAAADKAFWL